MFARKFILISASALALLLSACTEMLSIPSVSVREDGQLAFLVQADSGTSLNLQVLNQEDRAVQRVGTGENIQGAFDWNDADNSLVFVEISPEGDTLIQHADTSTDEAAETLTTLTGNLWVNQISVSPTGDSAALSISYLQMGTTVQDVLAANVEVDKVGAGIMLLDLTTGETTQIFQDSTGDSPSVSWNPSGTRLVYAYAFNAFVYDVAQGTSTSLDWLQDQLLQSPSWVTDTTVALISAIEIPQQGTTPPELYTFGVVTSATQSWELPNGAAVLSASPDGMMIAYLEVQQTDNTLRYASATGDVVVLNLSDSTRQTVFTGESLDKPIWSADSQTLYITNANVFSMFANNQRQLISVDVATQASTVLFEAPLATSSLVMWSAPEE